VRARSEGEGEESEVRSGKRWLSPDPKPDPNQAVRASPPGSAK